MTRTGQVHSRWEQHKKKPAYAKVVTAEAKGPWGTIWGGFEACLSLGKGSTWDREKQGNIAKVWLERPGKKRKAFAISPGDDLLRTNLYSG